MKPNIDRKRHLLKAITWRIVGSLDTLAITWIVTGEFAIGATVSAFETFNKIILYYIHERIWYRISWGVKHRKETEKKNDN